MRKIKLKTMSDVRRYLSRIINQVDSGELEGAKARDLGYLINILKSVIESGDLENRVAELEKILNEQRGRES